MQKNLKNYWERIKILNQMSDKLFATNSLIKLTGSKTRNQ